jgi:hypothetical protein
MTADNDSNGVTEKVGGLLPEVFFDIIGRVIPGSIILGLYGFGLLGVDQKAIEAVAWILSAYLIGFSIDIFMNGLLTLVGLLDNSKRIKKIKKLSQYDRSVIVKIIAEEVLFSSCSLISLVTIIVPPLNQNLTFQYTFNSTFLSFAALIVSIFGYISRRKLVENWLSV